MSRLFLAALCALTSEKRKSLSEVDWKKEGLTAGELIKKLAPAPAR